MPQLADEPITKVTMNFYTKDIEYIKARFPELWTQRVRKIIRQWVMDDKFERDSNAE